MIIMMTLCGIVTTSDMFILHITYRVIQYIVEIKTLIRAAFLMSYLKGLTSSDIDAWAILADPTARQT